MVTLPVLVCLQVPVVPVHVTPPVALLGLAVVNPQCLYGTPMLALMISCTLPACRPGGLGARQAVLNPDLLSGLAQLAQGCDRVLSVCTGAALLAAAGLLEGRWGGREGWWH